MRIRHLLVALTLSVLTPPLLFAAEPAMKMKEGRWDITLQADPPSNGTLPTVQPLCLTHKNPIPLATGAGLCKTLSQDLQGDTVFWVMECRNDTSVARSVGNATYDKTRLEGTVQITTTTAGRSPVVSNFKLSGRQRGACR